MRPSLFASAFFVLLGVVASEPSDSEQAAAFCLNPVPQVNFSYQEYVGEWYEIGRIQTRGGAIFQEDCVCTQLTVSPLPNGTRGDLSALNSCRKKTPHGEFLNVSSSLVRMHPEGHWFSTVLPIWLNIGVNYTVVEAGTDNTTGTDYSVEYDCGGNGLFGYNYCIHILSRKPTMSQFLVERLLAVAEGLGLNTQSLPFNQTQQDGCW